MFGISYTNQKIIWKLKNYFAMVELVFLESEPPLLVVLNLEEGDGELAQELRLMVLQPDKPGIRPS